ncbi:apolipoprotein N-acyltransferase [Arachidicoccus ginsenosidivorans]|uniref:Apolipoprotein N-acyltransferase n=1 Tax=Arachidicoccus ginsenosidivorans TaxID=496057 RepID=A0A5B8VPI5_9BACT|nr:apolipoprotein N-acyltransferase [Arachidicoccus ginsenosidivorans]QEC73544.1 apolipoprotein N-acyltransferase [Arachidicoccus ginsenosidivorans]
MTQKKHPSGESSTPVNITLWALLAGLMTGAAFTQLNAWLIWISFVPLFMCLGQQRPKTAFKAGLWFGVGLAACLFWWMIPGVQHFTGSKAGLGYGLIAFFVSCSLLSLYFGLIMWWYPGLTCPVKSNRTAQIPKETKAYKSAKSGKYAKALPLAMLMPALTLACIFTVAEFLLGWLTSGLPWLHLRVGLPLSTSFVLIQPVSLFGASILSFVVIFVNALFAFIIRAKAWKLLWIPVCVALLYAVSGYLLQNNFRRELGRDVGRDFGKDRLIEKQTGNNKGSNTGNNKGKNFTLAIVSENIAPQLKWDSIGGNQLAERLLGLSRQLNALASKPVMALWSESAIAWTYQKDDDLVRAILQNTRPAGITHLLGINTATLRSDVVYNSLYELDPDGGVISRYDKQVLLGLIEKPIGNLLIPFLSSAGFTALPGPDGGTLPTAYGKAGVLICNESTNSTLARKALHKGATFLLSPGNDGWFMNTYLTDLHFYNARLRAVETRKDIAINSNMGYCGLIQASGKIQCKQKSGQPVIYSVQIQPNNLVPFGVKYPHVLLISCTLFLVWEIIYRYFHWRQVSTTEPSK